MIASLALRLLKTTKRSLLSLVTAKEMLIKLHLMTNFKYHTFVNLMIVFAALLLPLVMAHFIPLGITKIFSSQSKVALSESFRKMIRLMSQVQWESVQKLSKSAFANIKIFHNFRYLKKAPNVLRQSFKILEKYLMFLKVLMKHL